MEAGKRRIDLLEGAIEGLQDLEVGPPLAAGLPAVHALAVTRRRSAELLRQSLLVAGLGLLPTGGQELQKLVKTARSLLIVIHPLLRCPSFPAAARGNGPRHGHLAGTDTGEPVSLRDRPGPGQEIY